MVSYDPSVIRGFADDLYRQATVMVRVAAITGFLLGGGVGGAIGAKAGPVREVRIDQSTDPSQIGRVIARDEYSGLGLFAGFTGVGVLCAFLARSMAEARASALRLQAQTALCQVTIEENTRKR